MTSREPQAQVTYERAHASLGRRGWIRVRIVGGYVEPRMPAACVGCLAPAEQRLELTGSYYGPSALAVRLCGACAPYWVRHAQRMQLYLMLALLVLTVCGIAVAWSALSGRDRWLATLVIVAVLLGFGGVAVLFIAQCYGGPVQVHPLSFVAPSMWIRFRNAAFAELYLRNEFQPAPMTPLPTPPPPARGK